MSDLQAGDIVRVKSGGPDMTIAELGNYSPEGPKNGAVCVWFEGKKKYQDVFDVAVLELVDKKERTGDMFRVFPRGKRWA